MRESWDRRIREWNHRRIDVMRALKLKWARSLFPLFSKRLKRENTDADILVFRLDDKIGDSITATGFLSTLKKNFPSSRLIVLSGRNAAFIYKQLSFIDGVHVVKKGLLSTLKIYFILRSRPYRFIFNTSHILTPQVIFLSSFLRAWKKITFLNSNVKSFTDHVSYDANCDHVTLRYQKSLEAVGTQDFNLDYHLNLPDGPQMKAAHKIVSDLRQKGSMLIVMNSFAGARLRNLNQKTTTEIVAGILENHPNAVVVSVGSDDDLKHVQYWVTAFRNPRWVCFSQFGSLGFNLALARQAELIVTPDTSWVHVASAFKVPVLAIYREDDAQEKNSLIWAPYRTNHRVVYAPFDPQKPHDINTVSTQEVVESIRGLSTELK